MSRDIGLRCLGTLVSGLGAGPAAWLLVLVAPVGLLGLDEMHREDLAAGEVGDGDVVVVGEREDAFGGRHAELVHPSGAADAHLAFGVEPVEARHAAAIALLTGQAITPSGAFDLPLSKSQVLAKAGPLIEQ